MITPIYMTIKPVQYTNGRNTQFWQNTCVYSSIADQEREFLHSCMYGDLTVVKNFIVQQGNIHTHDELGLVWACEMGHFDIVKVLVAAGANIHSKNGQVMQAAIVNYPKSSELISFLLEKKAMINEVALQEGVKSSEFRQQFLEQVITSGQPLEMYIYYIFAYKNFDLIIPLLATSLTVDDMLACLQKVNKNSCPTPVEPEEEDISFLKACETSFKEKHTLQQKVTCSEDIIKKVKIL